MTVIKNVSEDDDSNSDRNDSVSETESDDTSNDEYVSQENDSDDSVSSIDEEEPHSMNQSESPEKGGVLWSKYGIKAHGRFRAVHMLNGKNSTVLDWKHVLDCLFKLVLIMLTMNRHLNYGISATMLHYITQLFASPMLLVPEQ